MDRAIIRLIRKAGAKSKLRSFLDVNEPQLVQFLQTLWQNQGRAITYKELREAILSGEFSEDGILNGHYAEKWLNEWRQDYSRFVQKHMLPAWEKAMEMSARELPDSFPERLTEWRFDPADTGVQNWMRTHGAAFVTNSTQTQLDGLRAVLRHAGASGMNVDELARVVRPMVGLTVQQTEANLKYYNALKDGGMKEKKALEKSILYGQRQHRYRGYNIARTELAFAYNHGALEGIRQAQKQGFIGAVVKKWVTADDERACSTCTSLDGHKIALDEDFNFYTRLTEPGIRLMPPAHPSCRCAVAFEEVAPGELGFAPPVQQASNDIIDEIQETSSTIRQDGHVDFADKKSVIDRLRQAQKDFADLDFEKNCTITSDGKVWIASGEKGLVDSWAIESAGSSLEGSYSYHNHPPKQTWYSFSAEDVAFFICSGADFSMASDHIYEYNMRRTEKTVAKSHDEVYHRFKEIEDGSVMEMKYYEIIDPDLDGFHEVMKILSRELGFEYEREKKN